jgi:Putative adhesin
MRRLHRSVCASLALSFIAAPAMAQGQEPEWVRELVKEIKVQAKQFEVESKVWAKQLDVESEVWAKQLEIQTKVYLAQRGSAAAAEQRQAAQAAREAERQRRQDARRGPEYTEQVSKVVRLGRNGTFDLQNVGGAIVVTGGGGNDVHIDATKRVRNSDESQAKALLAAIEVMIYERNGNVEVRTEYPRRNWSGGVDYTVSVPRDANVVLRSVSGDVRVTNVNGELRAETVSGNVVTSGVRRVRLAKSISGDLDIADTEGDEISGGTVSGDVVFRNIKMRSVDVSSVSGDMRLSDVESDRTSAQSVSGDIEFSGRLSRSGRYEFRSHSGNVRVTPIGTGGFSLEAFTFSGDVRSDYPLTMQGDLTTAGGRPPAPPAPPSPGRLTSPPPPPPVPGRANRGIRGSFGDGSATLILQSFSGDIVITKK